MTNSQAMRLTLSHDPKVQRFIYFWVKYVQDVNLEEHCQKCLIGPGSKRVASRHFAHCKNPFEYSAIKFDEAPYKAIYICGVTEEFNWNNNFHLALAFAPGQSVKKSGPGVESFVSNAVELPIIASEISKSFRRYPEERYSTCRNAQFAWGFRNGIYNEQIGEGWEPGKAEGMLW